MLVSSSSSSSRLQTGGVVCRRARGFDEEERRRRRVRKGGTVEVWGLSRPVAALRVLRRSHWQGLCVCLRHVPARDRKSSGGRVPVNWWLENFDKRKLYIQQQLHTSRIQYPKLLIHLYVCDLIDGCVLCVTWCTGVSPVREAAGPLVPVPSRLLGRGHAQVLGAQGLELVPRAPPHVRGRLLHPVPTTKTKKSSPTFLILNTSAFPFESV